MKTYTYILCITYLLLISGISIAQPKLSNPKNLDAYVGIWEYRKGTEYFQIELKKGRENTHFFIGDCIVGGYLYQKNGQTIANYTHNIPLEFNDYKNTTLKIWATNAMINPNQVLSNKLRLYFYDEKIGYRTMHGVIELVSPTEIRWLLRHPEVQFSIGPAADRDLYTVPTDVIMNKVMPPPDPPGPPDPNPPGQQIY